MNGYFCIFKCLLTPTYLCHTNAPEPGGEITISNLHNWSRQPQCPMSSKFEMEGGVPNPMSPSLRYFPSKQNCRLMNVGAGNSELGEHLLRDGFVDITNVDYSSVVIKQMRQKYDSHFFADLQSKLESENSLRNSLGIESRDDNNNLNSRNVHTPKMTFVCADISEEGMYNYPDGYFDLILCKKTLDVVLMSEGAMTNAKLMMNECYRLLNKEHGVMLILSSAKPEDRAYYFEQNAWTGVENIRLPCMEDNTNTTHQKKGHERKLIHSYAYILYKQQQTPVDPTHTFEGLCEQSWSSTFAEDAVEEYQR